MVMVMVLVGGFNASFYIMQSEVNASRIRYPQHYREKPPEILRS